MPVKYFKNIFVGSWNRFVSKTSFAENSMNFRHFWNNKKSVWSEDFFISVQNRINFKRVGISAKRFAQNKKVVFLIYFPSNCKLTELNIQDDSKKNYKRGVPPSSTSPARSSQVFKGTISSTSKKSPKSLNSVFRQHSRFNQLTYFSNYWNLVNKAISGNLVKIFSFSEK